MRRFECTTKGSNKFWTIDKAALNSAVKNTFYCTVVWGKINTQGTAKEHSFNNCWDRDCAVDKLVDSKLKKGYVEIVPLPVNAGGTDIPDTWKTRISKALKEGEQKINTSRPIKTYFNLDNFNTAPKGAQEKMLEINEKIHESYGKALFWGLFNIDSGNRIRARLAMSDYPPKGSVWHVYNIQNQRILTDIFLPHAHQKFKKDQDAFGPAAIEELKESGFMERKELAFVRIVYNSDENRLHVIRTDEGWSEKDIPLDPEDDKFGDAIGVVAGPAMGSSRD